MKPKYLPKRPTKLIVNPRINLIISSLLIFDNPDGLEPPDVPPPGDGEGFGLFGDDTTVIH